MRRPPDGSDDLGMTSNLHVILGTGPVAWYRAQPARREA